MAFHRSFSFATPICEEVEMHELKYKIARRQPIIGAAIGSGMSAAAVELGGIDFLIVLSAGYFRLHGCSSMATLMPYSNANQLTWQLTTQCVMTHVNRTPVFIGVCAQDPHLDLEQYFNIIKKLDIVGIINYPSVDCIDGRYREALEETELGLAQEIEMLSQARKHGLMTIGFCSKPEDAAAMAVAGSDIICLNLGFAEWRNVDFEHHEAAIDWAVNHMNTVVASVNKVNPKPYIIIAGGPVVLPQDLAQVYQRTRIHGYIGGSTIEQFPATPIIAQTVREFKHVLVSPQESKRLGAMIGVSSAMQHLFEIIHRVAQSEVPVLIVGETGTGKELVAHEIHRLSKLNKKSFVCCNCGAVPETLAESELFGHEKGAFTGAVGRAIGKFELADGGTLFMDEVADLSLSVQSALLRAIQEKEIVRVGGEENIKISVRLIAASNQEFSKLIRSGLFRLDLYYRLSTVVLRIPPLRERQEDIPVLVLDFVHEFSEKYSYPVPHIPESVMSAFVNHDWPGNIRELRNAIENCFILGLGKTFSMEWLDEIFKLDRDLEKPTQDTPKVTRPLNRKLIREKREQLPELLARHKGNKSAVARELGISRKTIYNWLETISNRGPGIPHK